MGEGALITLVTGPPGAGKTFYAVREVVQALSMGRYVATNVVLADAWEKVARKRCGVRTRGVWGDHLEERLRRQYRPIGTVLELLELRLPGEGESRGLVVLDEAHLWLNAREWRDGDRKAAFSWFAQHRKLGWDCLLISQSAEAVDRQVRNLAEHETTLRNLRRVKVGGIRVAPGNLFVANTFWAGHHRQRVRTQIYRLDRKVARLYSTMATHDRGGEDLDQTGNVEMLPEIDRAAVRPARKRRRTTARPKAGAPPRPRFWRSRRAAEDEISRVITAGVLGRRDPITGELMRFDPITGQALRHRGDIRSVSNPVPTSIADVAADDATTG